VRGSHWRSSATHTGIAVSSRLLFIRVRQPLYNGIYARGHSHNSRQLSPPLPQTTAMSVSHSRKKLLIVGAIVAAVAIVVVAITVPVVLTRKETDELEDLS
jgi:hypothetical protein